MRLILAALLAAPFIQPSHADEWVRIDRPAVQASGVNREIYIDRSSITRDGDGLEFDRVTVFVESKAYRAAKAGWRISYNCEWETVRYAALPSPTTPDSQSSSAFQRELFDSEVTGIAAPLCSGTMPEGDVLVSEAAMLDDAARRLGFVDWAAASDLPPAPVFVKPASPVPPAPPLSDQEFGVAFPATGNRATILLKESLKRDNDRVSGTSIWVANVGVKPQPYQHQIRDYSRRAFLADCGNGTIALEALATGLRDFAADQPARPPNAPQARPRPGSASAMLWAVACTNAPMQRLANVAELLAYLEAPHEDPVFRARRSVRYSHDQVRWLQTPSPGDLAASLEQSVATLSDLKGTSIWCAVTRDYKLVDCEITTNTRYHEELEDAHLKFADRYVPVATTIDGQDIAGRTVEASIEWRADGARLKPLTYEQSELAWESSPSEADILRARIVNGSSEVAFRCSVSPAYELSDCSAPSLTVRTRSFALTYHDLMMTGLEKTEERTRLARSVRERVLPLLRKFKPPRATRRGEDTAGQYVDIKFTWK